MKRLNSSWSALWRVVEPIRQGRIVQWGVGFLISVYLALIFLLEDFYPAWLRIAMALCVFGLYLGLWSWLPKGTSEKPADNKVQLGFGTLIIIALSSGQTLKARVTIRRNKHHQAISPSAALEVSRQTTTRTHL